MAESQLFDVMTPLGFKVHCTEAYWQFISQQKHPVMAGRLQQVIETLKDPDEVRQSLKDPRVYLFYRADLKRWIAAVAKQEDGQAFLVTAYPTDNIKIGDVLWARSK